MKRMPGTLGVSVLRLTIVLGMKANVGTISAPCTAFNIAEV